ncbi:hypothetical protein M422DRAFT_251874 [Sphaerobolus stellatus SS14]|uniref:FAD-binding PCMH-type domain-containing protein n=1 Tax=Sphaerobolus stellatus (strain SS14) TaxID=990650 RepID=A0A0C9VZQ6_SPHS4|nr:hypothetical protein M422DRAFT_251874 [Sphaerobolus stellatus SS14]
MQLLGFTILLTSLFPLLDTVQGSLPSTTACSLLTLLLPGKVAFPSSTTQYVSDNEHWAGSSSQPSICSVEPSTPGDVAVIFGTIQKIRTTWAVKGGGHAYNSGFSSTDGVMISLAQFKEINYSPASSTLTPLGVTVVGGRVSGVGVAGLSLGGGYSWITQKYGLGIDNIVSYELVTPNAQILTVTAQSHPDIFFGLRGGGNNFGIVTAFVLKAHPQGQVYGGMLVYIGDIPAIRQAIQDFDPNNNDPNALILPSDVYEGGTLVAGIVLFYDGPTPPNGTFDAFLAVPGAVKTDVKARSFPDFVQSITQSSPARVASHTVPIIRYTQRIVDAISKLLGTSGLINNSDPNAFAALSIEPFNSDLYDHSTGGAYPHSPAHPWTPFQILIGYTDPTADNVTLAAARTAAAAIQQVAIEEEQSSPDAILYSNYAQKGTDLKLLFGDNLPLLRTLQAKYDSHDLLSLTGGWRF